MGERTSPEIEVLHPEVEILPPDHSEPGAATVGRHVWLSVDAQGNTRRVYVAKPGPIVSFLLVLAFCAMVAFSFVVALGLFALLLSVSAIAVAGLFIYGLFRRAVNRLR